MSWTNRHGGGGCSATLALVALIGGGCGPRGAVAPPTPTDRACTVAAAAAADSASVVLTWPVDARNAPRPTNPGERFVFELSYETLVRVDCIGRTMPALASSWALVEGGTRLRLVLRDSARFWSGATVTADDVIASWRAAGHGALADAAFPVDSGVLELDCRILAVNGSRDCPVLATLGSPELSVTRRTPGATWPEGTGSYRISAGVVGSGPASRPALRFVPVRAGGPRLTIHTVGQADARDLVDAGADLLLTDDPSIAAYAASPPERSSIALPWDRTWALLTPRPVPDTGTTPGDPDTIAARTRGFRTALARDVVRAEARPAESPFWWYSAASCRKPGRAERRVSARRPTTHVAVRADEPIARALAERIVALAATRPAAGPDSALALLAPGVASLGGRATAIALSPNDFAPSVRAGSELAYVMPLSRRSLDPCLGAERLREAAPWLPEGLSPPGQTGIVPLVDTRLLAVVRRNWLGLTMTWDSTITIPLVNSSADRRQ